MTRLNPSVWYAGNDAYHTHEECHALKRAKNPRKITLQSAERRGLERCGLARCARRPPEANQLTNEKETQNNG